jgi:diguanylate cyclase (GGDEF)-like protein
LNDACETAAVYRPARGMEASAALRRVLDGALDAIVAFDRSGSIVGWNRAAATMFGWAKDEALGRNVVETVLVSEGVEATFSSTQVDDGIVYTALLRDVSERKRLEHERENEHRLLEAVARATRRLSGPTTMDDARRALAEAALEVADATVAFVAEPDADSDELIITAMAGGLPNDVGVLPGRLGRGTGVHRAHTTGAPFFSPDTTADPRAARASARAAGLKGGLIQPIRRGDLPLGVLAVSWDRRVDDTTQQMRTLMAMLADEGAVALQRARDFTGLMAAARTDPLTGLANLRAWDEALNREVARASRSGRPLSVAVVDFDRLKEINDTLGHQAGDRALRSAVSAWQSVLRQTDLLARPGGDEFAAMLPDCALPDAEVLGERLRIATPEGYTCSVGVAQWREDEPAETLIERADRALYAAKHAGRNRTVAAS